MLEQVDELIGIFERYNRLIFNHHCHQFPRVVCVLSTCSSVIYRSHDHHALGSAVGVAALDVKELFRANVGAKARFCHAVTVLAHLS